MRKTYSGKGYKEHFERIAAINGWITNAEKVQYLTISLENPASDILRNVNEKSENAYNDIWSALARRFAMLDGPRESIRRFDARRQNENETLVEYEQALRMLHREGWPTATIEQRDAALKRRFEEGLLSNEMTQFLRLHARDSYFTETVTKDRQFAEASGNHHQVS